MIEGQVGEDPHKMVPAFLDGLWKEPGFKVIRGPRDLKPFLLEPKCADFVSLPYEEAMERPQKALRRPELRASTTSAR